MHLTVLTFLKPHTKQRDWTNGGEQGVRLKYDLKYLHTLFNIHY